MTSADSIAALFRPETTGSYDFTRSPRLVRRRAAAADGAVVSAEQTQRWSVAQSAFLRWTADRKNFSRDTVQEAKTLYDRYFGRRGLSTGSVLDIGGGWGLYRQWWSNGPGSTYVVHDPGVERFEKGPHAVHAQVYEHALSLPMTFVEGFGEDLPYRDGAFDTCIIAAALDHCIDPSRVLAEARRCLKPGGQMIVLQHSHSHGETTQQARQQRIARVLRNPGRIIAALRARVSALFAPDHHLHHFHPGEIEALLRSAGFDEVTTSDLGGMDVYACEARR